MCGTDNKVEYKDNSTENSHLSVVISRSLSESKFCIIRIYFKHFPLSIQLGTLFETVVLVNREIVISPFPKQLMFLSHTAAS